MTGEKIVHAKSEAEVPAMKTIGILGGMGQWATMDIVDRILKYSAKRNPQWGNRGYPPMVIQMINSSNLLLNPDGSVIEPPQPAPELFSMAKFVGANADILIMPSNTPHLFIKEVEKAAGKLLISLVDVAIAEVVRRQAKKVGVLAIGPTVRGKLYQKPLADLGIKSVTLPEELSKKLDDEAIYMVQEGENPQDFSGPPQEAVDYLKTQNVDTVILGCTEIPLLLEDNDPLVINPSQLLAEAAVEAALKTELLFD